MNFNIPSPNSRPEINKIFYSLNSLIYRVFQKSGNSTMEIKM